METPRASNRILVNGCLALAIAGLSLSSGCAASQVIRYYSSPAECASMIVRAPEPSWTIGNPLFSETTQVQTSKGRLVMRPGQEVTFEGFDEEGGLVVKYHHPRPIGGRIIHYDSALGTKIPVRLDSPKKEQIHILGVAEDALTYEVWPDKDGCP